MNLICNNCIGAQIYNYKNIKYNNPFIWNWINIYDFIKLYINYNDINLLNFNVSLENRNNKSNAIVTLNDKLINIHFIHYILNSDNNTPVINGSDVEYSNILEYTKIKWEDRTLRNSNEVPIFLYSFNFTEKNGVINELEMLLNYESKYKLIIICYDSLDISKYIIPKNVKIIKLSDDIMALDRIEFTKYLMENTNINELLNE